MTDDAPGRLEIALEHATRDVPMARPEERVADVRARMLGRRFTSAGHVVVCEGDHFAGIVRTEELLAVRRHGDPRHHGFRPAGGRPRLRPGGGRLAGGSCGRIGPRGGGPGAEIRRPHPSFPASERAPRGARRGSRPPGGLPAGQLGGSGRQRGAGGPALRAPEGQRSPQRNSAHAYWTTRAFVTAKNRKPGQVATYWGFGQIGATPDHEGPRHVGEMLDSASG